MATSTLRPFAVRKDNPVWDTCKLTGVDADLRADGNQTIVTVTISVKNSGKKAVTDFAVPLRATTIDFGLDKEEKGIDTLGLTFEPIGPGQEVTARGEFKVEGRPKGLWVGMLL